MEFKKRTLLESLNKKSANKKSYSKKPQNIIITEAQLERLMSRITNDSNKGK